MRRYFDAACIGYDKTETSIIYFFSDERLTRRDLGKEIPIINFKRIKIRRAA